MSHEVALMFSGGVDSTMAAALLAERFDRVHLLTYHNGHGTAGMSKSRARVEELRARFGSERFVHVLDSTKEWMQRVVTRDLVANYKEYGSGFIWCMGCKLAMHARSAVHCLENGVRYMADGSSGSTQEMVEQMMVSLSLIRVFYAGLGIHFFTPVYDLAREAEQAELKRRGFRMGIQIMGRNVGIQPSCYAGLTYYLPYLLFNKPPDHDESNVARFIRDKSVITREIVAEWFATRGRAMPHWEGVPELPFDPAELAASVRTHHRANAGGPAPAVDPA